MRRNTRQVDYKALAEIGPSPASVMATDGKPLVTGLFARRRGRKMIWLMRYRNTTRTQRELVLGFMSDDGVLGRLAIAINGATALGAPIDFRAELLTAKGAKEPVPAHLIGEVAGRVRTMLDSGVDLVAERQGCRGGTAHG
jgi:hypothetical protein